MKHVLVALLVGVVGILMWTHTQHPTEWQEWKLQTQKNIAELTGKDVSVIEESLFFLRRDSLLDKYDRVEEEYTEAKEFLEGEFKKQKENIETEEGEDLSIEQALVQFKERIAEKKALFEERKAEIELEIAEVRQKYEETKAALQALNDSVKKIQEGAKEGVEAVEALKEVVQ